MICPRCRQDDNVKNGLHRNKQRYKCKNCKCNFTQDSNPYDYYCSDTKKDSIKEYLKRRSFRKAAKAKNINNVIIRYWTNKLVKRIKECAQQHSYLDHIEESLSENLYSYVNQNPQNFESGKTLKDIPKEYWDTILKFIE